MEKFEDIVIIGVNKADSHPLKNSHLYAIHYDLKTPPDGNWIQQFQSEVRPYLKDSMQVNVTGSQIVVHGTLATIKVLENQLSAPIDATNKAISSLFEKAQIQVEEKNRQLEVFLESSKFSE